MNKIEEMFFRIAGHQFPFEIFAYIRIFVELN